MAVKIEIKNLTKVFGKTPKKVLKCIDVGMGKDDILKETGHTVGVYGADLEIKEGEIFVIMGLSGSGKSTMIRCFNLLNKPTRGEILVDGQDIVKFDKKQLRDFRQNKISMVFQHFGLFNHKNVIENVEFGMEVKGIPKEKRYKAAKDALAMVDLQGWEEQMIDQLSGGMQQRVGIARALANDPEILLMDEPFSALDPLIRGDMHVELLDIQSKLKKTMVFITHDINEAFKLGDRVAIMKDGHVVQVGTPEEIIANPENDYVAKFINNIDRSRILKVENIMKKVKTTVGPNMAPKIAVREMKEYDQEWIFVVDGERKPLGILTIDDCIDAVESGKKLNEIMKTDFMTTTSDMFIKELLPIAVESKYPIAVVNKEGRLKDVVYRVSVLSALV
jgi:glycine betaine/proline transport system ATP-binding protein